MKKIGVALIAVLLVAVAAGLALLRRDSTTPGKPVTIGVVMSLTGPAADQGKDILSGIELALDEINSGRTPGEPTLKLAVEDDLSTPNGGVSAITKLIQTQHPPAVIGPIASSIMLAMIPVAEREKTVLLSPAASSPQISNAGKYIFRIS